MAMLISQLKHFLKNMHCQDEQHRREGVSLLKPSFIINGIGLNTINMNRRFRGSKDHLNLGNPFVAKAFSPKEVDCNKTIFEIQDLIMNNNIFIACILC